MAIKASTLMSPHVVYRFYDASDRLLYIGLAANLGQRLQQHERDQPWWVEVARITIERHPDRLSAAAAETQAIIAERPFYNIKENPAAFLRPEWLDAPGSQQLQRSLRAAYRQRDSASAVSPPPRAGVENYVRRACDRFAASRRTSRLSEDTFAEALTETVGWQILPELIRAWEADVPPPGDVQLAGEYIAAAYWSSETIGALEPAAD